MVLIKRNSYISLSMIRDFHGKAITDPDVKQLVDNTHTAAHQLTKMVNDFLQVSRLERGKIAFEKVAFDLSLFKWHHPNSPVRMAAKALVWDFISPSFWWRVWGVQSLLNHPKRVADPNFHSSYLLFSLVRSSQNSDDIHRGVLRGQRGFSLW